MLLKNILKIFIILIIPLFFFNCKKQIKNRLGEKQDLNELHFKNINKKGETVVERILLPSAYKRVAVEENSFEDYLRNFPLSPHGTYVKTYNGNIIQQDNLYVAVFDIDTGEKNLQQCADAIIRLRAEFLYKNKEYTKINFLFTNGYQSKFVDYAEGFRVNVVNNKIQLYKTNNRDYSYNNFKNYLEQLFIYAGTYSLANEMSSVKNILEMKIGDVLVQGGSPGHAVIVVDMAENIDTREKIFLLAQSYMPAQDIHILINENDLSITPWYKLKKNPENIFTPCWKFTINDLKRFR